jgi:hypothetical protein
VARGASGVERLVADPRRTHELAMAALHAETGVEASEVLATLAAVDIPMMTAAARVIADAIAVFDPARVQSGIDLPLIFIGGEGATTHTADRLLSIDVGGADTYRNNAGGALVDNPAQASLYGIGGSVALDYGADDDSYQTLISGQGFAVGAVGLLFDEGGSDTYDIVDAYGHGAALAGVGMLYDAGSGDDEYLTVWEPGEFGPTATKGSSLGGIATLVDEGGSDIFRQDGVDGIGWGAGRGLGLVASLGEDDDTFRSDGSGEGRNGGVIQGNAEVFGAGVVYDEGGNDAYSCNGNVRQGCQGTGADAGLGLLWDRAGDDSYTVLGTTWCDLVNDDLSCVIEQPEIDIPASTYPIEFPIMVLGQGAGYMTVPPGPPGLGVLFDEDGADSYSAPKWAQGYGVLGNLGLLYDRGGADTYDAAPPLVGTRSDGNTWLDGLLGIGIDE